MEHYMQYRPQQQFSLQQNKWAQEPDWTQQNTPKTEWQFKQKEMSHIHILQPQNQENN
jgi:hypothetical protein